MNSPGQNDGPDDARSEAPFGLPRAPLHRFSFESPRIGWGFLDTYHGLPAWGGHGWTDCYLILWDGAVHDDAWFAQNRDRIVWAYDNWEAPHYGDAVVLHQIHLQPGVRPEEREEAESETIRLALRHLRNPIPADGPVTVWQSVQYQEKIDAGVFYIYQALFLEPEGERDLLRLAYTLRSVEDCFEPPESLRLDHLELKGWEDCCVEVSVPRDPFREAYRAAVFVH